MLKPVPTVLKIAAIVAGVEAVITLIRSLLPPLSPLSALVGALVDAGALALISSLAIYRLVLRPAIRTRDPAAAEGRAGSVLADRERPEESDIDAGRAALVPRDETVQPAGGVTQAFPDLGGLRTLVVAEAADAGRWLSWLDRLGLQTQAADSAVRAVSAMAAAARAGTPFDLLVVGPVAGGVATASLIELLATLPGHGAARFLTVGPAAPAGVDDRRFGHLGASPSEPALVAGLRRLFPEPVADREIAADPDGDTAAPGPEPDIDGEVLGQLLEDFGLEDMAGLVGAFLAETEVRIAGIAAAAVAGDHDALEREAHTLKGNAGNLGFAGLAAAAGTLVEFCRTGDRERANRATRDIAPEFERLVSRLKQDYPQLMV